MTTFVREQADAKPAVSIVIPSYQSERVMLPCLRALARQAFNEPTEVVLVDSSTDGTRTLVRSEFPSVRIRERAGQTWPGEARNVGVESARGDLIIFLDADTVPQPGWLRAMVERLRRGDAAVVLGAVQSMHTGSLVAHAAQICEFSGFTIWDRAREVAVGPALTMGVRRDRLDAGAWRFPRLRCCEDIMFCRGVSRAGDRIVFEPAAVVAHNDPVEIWHLAGKMELIGRTGGPLRLREHLPGAAFARHPGLIALMPSVRTVVALARTFRWGWRPWWRSMRAAHLVFRVMWAYAKGFRAGLKEAAG